MCHFKFRGLENCDVESCTNKPFQNGFMELFGQRSKRYKHFRKGVAARRLKERGEWLAEYCGEIMKVNPEFQGVEQYNDEMNWY